MKIEIRKYIESKDYDLVLKLIESEGEEWEEYLMPKYKQSLEQSITLLAFCDSELCGYARSLNDPGFFVWVIDLLVHKKCRGNSIGKKLLNQIQLDFPNQEVLVMSDVDAYYEKLGFHKEGSIFKVK